MTKRRSRLTNNRKHRRLTHKRKTAPSAVVDECKDATKKRNCLVIPVPRVTYETTTPDKPMSEKTKQRRTDLLLTAVAKIGGEGVTNMIGTISDALLSAKGEKYLSPLLKEMEKRRRTISNWIIADNGQQKHHITSEQLVEARAVLNLTQQQTFTLARIMSKAWNLDVGSCSSARAIFKALDVGHIMALPGGPKYGVYSTVTELLQRILENDVLQTLLDLRPRVVGKLPVLHVRYTIDGTQRLPIPH